MDKFKMIRDAGFEGVEPMGSMDRGLKSLQGEGSRRICSFPAFVMTRCIGPSLFRIPIRPTRAIGLEGLRTALQDCKTYGGSSVLLVPGKVDQQVSYDDAYKRSQEEIRKAIPLAEELGVKIAIENVWNDFLLSPLEAAKRYVDEFNSPAVGWHFDIGNVFATGWPEQWIRILGKRIQKLHIKEYSREEA